jgi:PilZ domain
MEHRSSPRTRTILQGRVVFNDRFSLIECIVRDLSEIGAQIAFSHPITLPSELELEIPRKQLSTRARVMWSNGKVHGLLFLGATQGEVPSNSPVALDESEPKDNSLPQEVNASSSTLRIHEVLTEARSQIAKIAGVPVETVRLKLEIDF